MEIKITGTSEEIAGVQNNLQGQQVTNNYIKSDSDKDESIILNAPSEQQDNKEDKLMADTTRFTDIRTEAAFKSISPKILKLLREDVVKIFDYGSKKESITFKLNRREAIDLLNGVIAKLTELPDEF